MKKLGVLLLSLLLLWGTLLPVGAEQTTTSPYGCIGLQASYAIGGAAYEGTAKAALLYELNSQTMVCAYNADERIDPSGLVKIMTALVALEQVQDLDAQIGVRNSTLSSVPSGAKILDLRGGDTLTVRDLLYCVMVYSANDATVVLAEHVAGSQEAFVRLMNEKALALGCANTRFANVHGLSSNDQYSTCRDLAVITAAALENETFVQMFGAVNYELPETVSCNRELTTTCHLLNPNSSYYNASVTGGKPAKDGKMGSLICVGEGEEGRYLCIVLSATESGSSYKVTFSEATALLKQGLEGYSLQQVLDCTQPYGLYAVSGGENGVVAGPDQDVYALLPVELEQESLRLYAKMDEQSLHAPLSEGTAVGVLQVYYGQVVVAEATLLARHAVAAEGTSVTPASSKRESGLRRIVKWMLIGGATVIVLFGGGLLVLRRINLIRYKKKRRYTRPATREEASK